MNRTERLFQIVEILRSRKITTAAYLAERLGLSVRTIYRHVNDLSLSGIPIISEAGVGYWLDESFDMPPLMFTEEEILALSFGAKLVQQTADDFLADAASSLLKKVQQSLPIEKKKIINQITLHAPFALIDKAQKKKMAICREAIDCQRIVAIEYSDANDNYSERIIWPLALVFWGKAWTLASWCEKRQDFRAFRLDRMFNIVATGQLFQTTEAICLQVFVDRQTANANANSSR